MEFFRLLLYLFLLAECNVILDISLYYAVVALEDVDYRFFGLRQIRAV